MMNVSIYRYIETSKISYLPIHKKLGFVEEVALNIFGKKSHGQGILFFVNENFISF